MVQQIPTPRDRSEGPETLLRQMRAGDRDAAALFVDRYGELIRLRVRDKIGMGMRRVLDSEDVLSTVARRLDGIVHDGRLRAETQGELWSLISGIVRNVVAENIRVRERDRAAFRGAAEAAQASGGGAEAPVDDEAGEGMADHALRAVGNETDQGILWMWLRDRQHTQIARSIGASPASVRMRWSRIKRALRSLPERETA